MGFLTPGKSTKKRTRDHKEAIARVKRSRSRQTTPETRLQVSTPSPSPLHIQQVAPSEPRAILEKLPVELIHEIFIHAGLNSLPFVNKLLCAELTPSLTLRVRMLQNYIHDLNSGLPELNTEHKTRYALERDVLNYRFITADVLRHVSFDTVLPVEAIEAEKKNRLVLHYDRLNKKMLDALKRIEASDAEINVELQRIAIERERLGLDDAELSDLVLEHIQDYPKRFYEGSKIDERHLLLIEELHNRSMKFMHSGRILSSAINAGHEIATLSRLLACTDTGLVTTSEPLRAAFDRDDLELVNWLLSMAETDSNLVSDDDLWVHLSKTQNTEHLRFLELRGGVPSHEILGTLTSSLTS